MAIKVPSTPPSSRLHRRALPLLISKLNDPSIHSSPSELLDLLQSTLQILSHAQLNPPKSGSPLLSSTIPLEALLHLSLLSPSSISLPPLVSAIIAYPNHPDTISTIISSALKSQPTLLDAIRTEIVPNLVTRLRLSPSPPIVRVLHLLLRSHEEILGVLLSEADYILPALHDSYTRLTSIRAKSDALLVCHALVQAVQGGQSGEALKRLMRDSGSSSGRKVLVDTGLSEDYEAIFGGKEGIEDGELGVLRRMRDEEVASDPRLESITSLFPYLPPHLFVEALNHPSFASTAASPEEQAAPLVDAILRGGEDLPDELGELKRMIMDQQHESVVLVEERPEPARTERRNIWAEEELDISRLRLGKDDAALPKIGTAIPDHLRASILRLVQSQAEEAEAQAAALREGHDDVDDDGIPAVRIRGDGDESGDDDDGDKVVSGRSSDPNKTYDVDQQTKLELAYLTDPKVFDRDSGTRRGEARKQLKEVTGMDDAQLEGWKIMLDRNPHKEAILARHQFTPASNHLAPTPRDRGDSGNSAESSRGGGRGHGRDGGGGGSGGGRGGGGGGGRGGGGGSGGGGGRGRGQSKGSRGHSNAARTRGHDKKMTRMGAGAGT